jgi:hypothetical protein
MRVFFYLRRALASALLRDDDRVSDVSVEKLEALDDPRVETAVHVRLHFLDEVRAVLEPGEIGAWRGGEDRLFTFFAVVSVVHRTTRTARRTPMPATKFRRRSVPTAGESVRKETRKNESSTRC